MNPIKQRFFLSHAKQSTTKYRVSELKITQPALGARQTPSRTRNLDSSGSGLIINVNLVYVSWQPLVGGYGHSLCLFVCVCVSMHTWSS